MREQVAEEGLGRDAGRCVVRDLSRTSDDEIVRAYVDPEPRVLIVPILVCTIRAELVDVDLPASLVNCIMRDARRELTTGALGRKLAEDPANISFLQGEAGQRFGARLARACVRKLNLSSA